MGDQHESAASTSLLQVQYEGQHSGSHADDPNMLLEEILDLDTFINELGMQDGSNISNEMGENYGMVEKSHNPSGENDGYLELNDIFDNANAPCNSNLMDGLCVQNDCFLENGLNETSTLLQVDGTEFCFDVANETPSSEELNECEPAEAMYNLQPADFLNTNTGDYLSGQLTEEDVAFYDAPSDESPCVGNFFPNTDCNQFSPATDLSGFDMVDDLMAYFDATDNLQYDILGSEFVSQSNTVSEVEDSGYTSSKTRLQVPGTNIEMGASSSFTGPTEELKLVDKAVVPDMQASNTWNNALKKHVVDMLGSISAPPAMAEVSLEGKATALLPATNSSSFIHVSAGLIQIQGITVMGTSEEHWTLQKNGDMSFLFSYEMASNGGVGRSVCFKSSKKMHGGALGMLLSGGIYLFGLSVLILSVSLKVGLSVYTK